MVNPHRGFFFVVGRSQRCEAPARPVYVFQYMWHPRRAVRLCAFVPDPHPAGVVGGGWGCSAQASSLRLRLHYDTCLQHGIHTLRACFTDTARCVPTQHRVVISGISTSSMTEMCSNQTTVKMEQVFEVKMRE